MYILDSGCGWIPDAPVKFMYHIINLIKNLTPVILIIMGSLDFGKAVMSQKEDDIKKAQGAFIKKVIAGAAVFFVIVFAKWVVKILDEAGGNTGNAFSCVSLLLNGKYSADDKSYYDGPNTTKENTTNSTTKKIIYSVDGSCWAQVQTIKGYESMTNFDSCKTLWKNKNNSNDDLSATMFCNDLCDKNPYQPTTNSSETPSIPDLTLDKLPLQPGFDAILINEEIQKQYENSKCWDNITEYAGYGACWSSIYNNNIQTNKLFTEEKARQICMKLCDDNT